jgi:hypothetical protein
VVHLAPAEGAWSRVLDGFHRIRSVFRVRWCGFRPVSSDLRLSSLTMVAALVRWCLGALARRLPVCLLQQALLRQALPGSGDGGVRTAARLRLALVCVVVARWSSDLIVFLLLLGFFVLLIIINGSVEFRKKIKSPSE